MQRSLLWAEDLEAHRQPALYYLDEAEAPGGPHLICDWNGVPTDIGDFDLDAISLIKEHEKPLDDDDGDSDENLDAKSAPSSKQQSQKRDNQYQSDYVDIDDKFVDFPNPAASITKRNKNLPESESESQCPLAREEHIIDDCAHLDFLSVPPITGGLLRRIVKNLQRRTGTANIDSSSRPTARASTVDKGDKRTKSVDKS